MGRYKEKETTSFSDSFPLPPPSLYSFEIEDTKTGRIGKGWGKTKQEARDNTWKDLKYGEKPKYGSGGGSGSGGGIFTSMQLSFDEELLSLFFLPLLFFILFFSFLFFLAKGCEFACSQAEKGINIIYSAYETKEEAFLRQKQEWVSWRNFVQGPEKRFSPFGNFFATPEGRIVFISQAKNSNGICFLDLQSEKKVELVKIEGKINSYDISSDRKKAVFVAFLEGNQEIHLANFGGRTIQLTETTDGYGGYEDVVWLSPETILATKISLYEKLIWQISFLNFTPKISVKADFKIPTCEEYNNDRREKATKKYTRNFFNFVSPTVSPDGTKIAYIKYDLHIFRYSKVKGTGRIVVKDLRSNKESVYSNMNAIRLTPQAWSPDGDRITFSAVDRAGKERIGVLELHRTTLPFGRVTWLRVAGNNPAWSPDGRWIVFDNEGEIYVFEIATGEVKVVPYNSEFICTDGRARINFGNVIKITKGEKPLWITRD